MLRLVVGSEAGGTKPAMWEERGQVTVPAGTKRMTAIDKAVRELGLELVAGQRTSLRLVPAEYAQVIPVTLEQPAPQLRVG